MVFHVVFHETNSWANVRGDTGSCIYGAGGSVSAQYELPFAMRMRTVCIEYIVTISAGTCVVSRRA